MIFYSPLKDTQPGEPARNACVAGGQNPPTLPMGIGRAQLEELYVKQELSSRQTAKALGVSATLVLRILREKDLPVRTKQQGLKAVWAIDRQHMLDTIQTPGANAKRRQKRITYFKDHPGTARNMSLLAAEKRRQNRQTAYQARFGQDVSAGLRDLYSVQGQSAADIAKENGLSIHIVQRLLVEHGIRQPGENPARVSENMGDLVGQARLSGVFGSLPDVYQDIIKARVPESGQQATLAEIGRKYSVNKQWVWTMQEAACLFLELQMGKKELAEPLWQYTAAETLSTLYNVWHLSPGEIADYFETWPEVIKHLLRQLRIQVKKGPRTRFERETAAEYLSRINSKGGQVKP